MNRKISRTIGLSNYLFFALTVIATLVFLLDSSRTCNEAISFCTISIFLMVFTVSMGMLVLLALLTGNYVHDNRGGRFDYGSVKMFFLEDINKKQIILIPVGLAMVFGVSYVAILANSPLAGIIASGLVMMAIFFYTKSAMPPIVIHGLYNAIVVFLRAQQLTLFSTSPVAVPDVSFQIFNQQTINEMLTQIVLVAPAEELFKIFMVSVFLIIVKLRFDFSGIFAKAIAGTSATLVWALYHLQISLNN